MSSTKLRSNRAAEEQLFNRQISAVATYITTPIQLGGVMMTPQQLGAIPQAALTALQAVDAALLNLQQKRQAAKVALTAARTTSAGVHAYLIGAYGKTSPVLTAFGFTSYAPSTATVEVKAMAIAKGAATRLDRHTMGPKQKLQIKGAVSTPVVTSAPAAAVQPAVVVPAVVKPTTG